MGEVMSLTPALPGMFGRSSSFYNVISDIVRDRRLIHKIDSRILNHDLTKNSRMTLWERFGFNVLVGVICGSEVATHEISRAMIDFPEVVTNRIFQFNEFVEVYARVYVESGQSNKVTGQIASAVKNDFGFAPLAHEMSIAKNYYDMGLRVNFTDLGDEERFDFLISNGDIDVAVECKCIQSDTGLPIKNHCVDLAYIGMRDTIINNRDIFSNSAIMFDIESPISSPESLSELLDSAADRRIGVGGSISNENARMIIFDKADAFSTDNSLPIVDTTKMLQEHIYRKYGTSMFTGFIPDIQSIDIGIPAICICSKYVSADHSKRVLDELKKDARKQLPLSSNSVMAIRFAEMSPKTEDKVFNDETDFPHLHALASELFHSERAGHLGGVIFVGNPRYREANILGPAGIRPTVGNRHSRWFANDQHPRLAEIKAALGWS